MAINILLVSEDKIKNNSLTQLNVESKILKQTIIDCQNIYLRDVLGTDLFNSVIEYVSNKINDSNFIIDLDKETLINDYIQPYLINSVQRDLIINLSYRISNKGLIKYSEQNATIINSDETDSFKDYIDNRTNAYKFSLIKYLTDNKLIKTNCKNEGNLNDNIPYFLPIN